MSDGGLEREVERLLSGRVAELSRLKFGDVIALPEAEGAEVVLGDRKCALTVFRQSLSAEECLVTVQLARGVFFGALSRHWERGLVFTQNEAVREATDAELLEPSDE